ncbi:MAG: alpha/beta hydrolase [Micavibrio sp.]
MITALCWTAIIYGAFVFGLFFAQRELMYFPGYTKPSVDDIGIIGLEEIHVETEDGLKLFGWYKPSGDAKKKVIVWFHGNNSNVGWTATRAIPYMNAGYGVLLAEYRGYASNPGSPSEEGLYEDARAFLKWLREDKGIGAGQIILYGESIGSGPAVKMAAEITDIAALVLEAPFTSAAAVARIKYPFVPVERLMRDRYDNLSLIGGVEAPLVIAHGTRDTVVPYRLGKKLFDGAPGPKSLITVEGAGHNDLDGFGIADKIMAALDGLE